MYFTPSHEMPLKHCRRYLVPILPAQDFSVCILEYYAASKWCGFGMREVFDFGYSINFGIEHVVF